MRATLLPDPHRGPGYSVIEIWGAPPLASPVLLLRRASDGAWLSGSGWGMSETSLTPDGWDSGPDDLDSGSGCQRLLLGPGLVDDLDPGDSYTLTIPGAGSCALMLAGVDQSHIIGGKPVGVTPPPVPGYTFSGNKMPEGTPQGAVNEGVERTPEVTGGDAGGLPSGVAVAPEDAPEAPGKKRPGCALMGVLLVAGLVWAGVALGHGTMRSPAAPGAVTEANVTAGDTSFALLPRTNADGEPANEDAEKPKS